MSLFDGIENAKVYGGGRYIEPGNWMLKVQELSTFESAQQKGRFYFCAEFEVIGTDVETTREGEKVTWLVNMMNGSALDNIKGFAMALTPGSSEADITPDAMEEMVSSDNPAAGIQVSAFAFLKTSREGNPYTRINWSTAS
jgi:hypothetical protein